MNQRIYLMQPILILNSNCHLLQKNGLEKKELKKHEINELPFSEYFFGMRSKRAPELRPDDDDFSRVESVEGKNNKN